MSRKRRCGHADGAKLVGWEALKARDAARSPLKSPSPFTDHDLARTLRTLGATLNPPPAPNGYWTVARGPTILATARRPRTALRRATLYLHRHPELAL
jgi:hypothetical protein